MNIQQYNQIRFLRNNQVCTINLHESELSPTTTILKFLRSSGNIGTKEGCGEGDCGACTVVIAELNHRGKIIYKAVNSCLVFIPQLQGKLLITIEDISLENELHPLQQAIIEEYGTQCGFCTPGVIMSAFALYKSKINTDSEIKLAMAGNLCRCTGYKSILQAIQKAIKENPIDYFDRQEPDIANRLTDLNNNLRSLHLRKENEEYFMPFSFQDALNYKNDNPDALTVNGCTDIALLKTKNFESFPKIIDLSNLSELKTIQESNDSWKIGANCTIDQISKELKDSKAVQDLNEVFASQQIRNLATLAGNLASASPINDGICLLMGLDAEIELKSTSSSRFIPIDEFITSYRNTVLHQDEFILNIIIPKKSSSYCRFYKISKRKDVDISMLCGCFSVEVENDNIKDIRLAFGGLAEKTKRAIRTEKALLGQKWSIENIQEAANNIEIEFTPISDVRSEKEYRMLAAKNLLSQFYLDYNE